MVDHFGMDMSIGVRFSYLSAVTELKPSLFTENSGKFLPKSTESAQTGSTFKTYECFSWFFKDILIVIKPGLTKTREQRPISKNLIGKSIIHRKSTGLIGF